jgi:two-component system LytT family response regulator
MKSIRTLIVDDELLGRSRIKKLLQAMDRIHLVGEGKSGEEAIKLIEDYKPDLVFLDVEMPDKDGFQVINGISMTPRPFIIFVTAHDRFALKAFDVNAIDFIHKPFDDQRFHKAVDHAIKHIELRDQSQLNHQFLRLVDDFRSKAQSNPSVITIKDRGSERKINLYDVQYIEAEGNYLKLQLDKERFLLRNTMTQMCESLDMTCFLRVHRSVIVNVNFLKQKSYKGNNEYSFKMRSGAEFMSGRSFKDGIDEFFAVKS